MAKSTTKIVDESFNEGEDSAKQVIYLTGQTIVAMLTVGEDCNAGSEAVWVYDEVGDIVAIPLEDTMLATKDAKRLFLEKRKAAIDKALADLENE